MSPAMSPHERTQITVTLVDRSGGRSDVQLAGPSAMRWSAVREAVAAAGHTVPEPAWIGHLPLAGNHELGAIPHGAVIAGAPLARPTTDLLSIECTHGSVVGRGLRLGRRPVTVGRFADADLRLTDPDVSRLQCRIELAAGRVTVTDLGSTNGTEVDGRKISGATELRSGSILRVGNTSLSLGAPQPAAPQVRDGRITVHRTPTRTVAPPPVRLTEPTRPTDRDRRRLPWLMTLAPLFIGIGLAWWMHTMLFLAFALFSPVLMLAQHMTDRKEGRSSRRRELADHAAALERHEAKVRAALTSERKLRDRAAPALVEAIRSIRHADHRLWHRHPAEYGYLHWRVGMGTTSSGVVVTDAEGDEFVRPMREAPVVVDLAAHRVVGVVAPDDLQRALLSSLLIQTVAWHSPRHLRIALVARTVSPGIVDLAWPPHLHSDGRRTVFGLDRPDELGDFLRARRRQDADDGPPTLLVLLLDGESASAAPELDDLVTEPARFGATVVAFAHTDSHLPDRARPVLRAESATRLVVEGTRPIMCVPDLPAPGLLETLVRRSAPLRDAVTTDGSEPPLTVSLADVWPAATETSLLDDAALQRHWTARRRPTMRAVLGADASGPVVVDLTVDGPHALIAGTTGSGKSELLQTMIASLAAANRPDALNFVLIDYKGGAAFRECARLPHTVGLVTDLDGHLTERALTSLSAELRRRERLLAEAGATDLDDYHRAPARPTIPRLVLVIDEYRVLAEELPDFVDGLVRLATVGRSLGVHLVLATQRPAGVVSADIRANVNLRIALRVRDDGDSQDVIETAAAARLSATVPGRAYLRAGGGEPVLFQTARVTVAPSIADAVLVSDAHGRLATVGPTQSTVLERLVGLATAATARLSAQPSAAPWLPPLPDQVAPDDPALDGSGEVSVTTGEVPVEVGYRFALADRPDHQDRPPLAWTPATDQHLALIGGPRSGRTTALRAVLAAALRSGEVHAYVLDLGRSLGDLADHACVGAVVGPDEPARVERVLDRLADEVAARRSAAPDHRPKLLLAIDGWDVLDELADDTALFRLVDLTGTILRDGPAADVHVVATGGRGLLTSRSLSMFHAQIGLTTPDREDLTALGVPRKSVPVRMPPGRGVTAPDGLELQIVQATDVPPCEPRQPVRRVPAIPETVLDRPCLPDAVAIGVGIDGPVGLPLGRRGEGAGLVAGPPGSGRTTTLRAIAAALSERPTCWVSPDSSIPLPHNLFRSSSSAATLDWLAANPSGVLLVDDVAAVADTDLEDALTAFAARSPTTGAVVFAAGDPAELAATYRGLVGELRRRGTGVLLMPNRTDGELFGVRCPKLDRSRPGRGYLVHRGELTELQVALIDDGTGQTRVA